MRKRIVGINVRVSPDEKEKLTGNAKLCGLPLSDYLRKLGLGKEVEATQSKKIYFVFRQIEALKSQIPMLTEKEIIRRLDQIQTAL